MPLRIPTAPPTPLAGIKGLLALRPELFEGSAAEHAIASARADVAAAEALLPGHGAALTIRRGSVRPGGSLGSFRAGGSLRGSGGSVISGMGGGGGGGSVRGGGTPFSGRSSLTGFDPSMGGRAAGVAALSPGSRAPSISSRMTSGGASTIGGAPMRLLAGGKADGAAAPGQSFGHCPRF